jgi:ferrous iron transport protein A
MVLAKAKIGSTYQIEAINSPEKMKNFLFSLGCFEGEKITLISKLASNYIINIKDSRYAMDENMAKTIHLIDN